MVFILCLIFVEGADTLEICDNRLIFCTLILRRTSEDVAGIGRDTGLVPVAEWADNDLFNAGFLNTLLDDALVLDDDVVVFILEDEEVRDSGGVEGGLLLFVVVEEDKLRDVNEDSEVIELDLLFNILGVNFGVVLPLLDFDFSI